MPGAGSFLLLGLNFLYAANTQNVRHNDAVIMVGHWHIVLRRDIGTAGSLNLCIVKTS